MKQRLCSAAVGLTLFAIVLCFYRTFVFNFAIGLICAIGVYELMKASGLCENKLFLCLGIGFGVLAPFFYIPPHYDLRIPAIILLVFLFFLVLLQLHNRVDIGKFSFVCGSSIALSFSLCCLIYIREESKFYALYYIFLTFALAWICDGGAYFVGRFFGKHKLAPIISPKKTIEGAIGGIFFNFIFAFILTAIFSHWVYNDIPAHIPSLLIITLLGSVLGMIGDLVASAIKRQFGIKDFGNLIPGHGGVIDRFDSVLFVLPFLYFAIKYIPVFGG